MSLEISNRYSSGYYAGMGKSGRGADATATQNAENSSPKSSDASEKISATDYYDNLREKYSDLKIKTGIYNPGTAAGAGLGNVMIHPDYIKKASNDPQTAAELENTLNGIPAAETWLENMCKMNGMELISYGAVIDENGDMSSWSVTRTSDETDNTSKTEKADQKEMQKKRQKEEAEQTDDATEAAKAQGEIAQQSYADRLEKTGVGSFHAEA